LLYKIKVVTFARRFYFSAFDRISESKLETRRKFFIETYKIMKMNTALAGTLESGDILIEITPAKQKGIEIVLDSVVSHSFGKQIRKIISQTLSELHITDATVYATDKGALDCTIRARVTAAACRATQTDVWE
jgi:citrate lyase subunit gamma (acyl carrier protein)